MKDSNLRSFIKGVTWRMTGTIDTMVMAFIVTGHIGDAIKIGLTEVFTKVGLYYLHERLWNIIRFGRIDGVGPTHARSLIKGISWRAVGTVDTILISYFYTQNSLSAIKIGGFEIFSKIALYYLHERVWGKLKWGRIMLPNLKEQESISPEPSRQEKDFVIERKTAMVEDLQEK